MASKGVAYSLSVTMAVIVALGGYGLAIKPKAEGVEQLKSAIAVESQYRDTMVDLSNRAQAVTAEFASVAGEAKLFNAAFPSASDQAGLIDSLNNVAKKVGVEISSLTPGKPQSLEQIVSEIQERIENGSDEIADGDPRYTYLTVDVSLKGSEKKQREFLKELEGMDRKLYIQGVSSNVSEGSGTLGVVLVAMITAPLEDPTAPTAEEPANQDESVGE